ncbi:hypothetical protein ABMA32_08990 [Mesorhizobium sp. VNQ89]|uniref:hypothetical protein n=1 Tax=Mesorhizobium quangtriensis TaxID=3157709 RepID=UPI0032B79D91
MAFVEGFEESRAHIARVADGQIIVSSDPIGRRFLGAKLAWSRDGSFIAATIREGQFLETDVVLLDASNLSVVVKLPCSPFAQDLLFLPDNKSLAFGGVNNRIKVMQLDDMFRNGRPAALN